MKDDPVWDVEGGMENLGPTFAPHVVQVYPSPVNTGVNYTAQFTQLYGPTLTTFELTKVLTDAVWEKAKKENDAARKQKDGN